MEELDDFSDSDDNSECSSVPSDDNDDSLSDSEISDEEVLLTSEDDTDNEDCGPDIQTAQPPEVLERSIPIVKCPGVPHLMMHKGYRICGDNWDKNVLARHMRIDKRNQSLHYFHVYAVENRVDFVSLSDQPPDNSAIIDFRSAAKSLLPSPSDDVALKRNISTLISRVLCANVEFFKMSFDKQVEQHIRHRYYEEMSAKSVVVSNQSCQETAKSAPCSTLELINPQRACAEGYSSR